jgi:hypothetical protein
MDLSRQNRWGWKDILLAIPSIPVLLFHVLFRSDTIRTGWHLYFFQVCQMLYIYIGLILFFTAISWIYPMAYDGTHSLIIYQDWVAHGCGRDGSVEVCNNSAEFSPFGGLFLILFQLARFPILWLSLLPGLDWIMESWSEIMGLGFHYFLRTGHINHNMIIGMLYGFFILALWPVWLVWAAISTIGWMLQIEQ